VKRWFICIGLVGALCAVAGSFLATNVLEPHASHPALPHEAVTDVEIHAADGAALRAWLFVPEHPNGGAVITLHGHLDNRRGTLGPASFLRDAGYYVVAPDSRGHGLSGGDHITFGVLEAKDIQQWADWIAEHTPTRRLYGLGVSYGGAVILQALSREPRLQAVVADSSFATFHQVAYDRIAGVLGVPYMTGRMLFWPAIEPGLMYASAWKGIDLYSASPLEALARSTKSVLLIHGLADRNIPPEHSRQLLARRPLNTTLWEVAGAGHCAALGQEPENYRRHVLEFFAAH
jgi:pimeloyl-ACP methyl ester carboxylesterase